MRAFLITPSTKTIEPVDVAGHADIATLIGYPTIESDEVGPEGDRLYFDEECFLRGDAAAGRLQLKGVAPVQGMGLIVGSSDGGATLRDAASDLEGLRARIGFL